MRVFVSWSGERSRRVGELLDQWLQCVIQAIDPWMSTKDIDRGALWFTEINNQLKETSVGVIVLTQENKEKPWILFEAGALAKGLTSSRVCIVLVDLLPQEVRDPLAQFNLTMPDKKGIWHLVSTLNSSLQENALKEKVLEQVFDTYWPQFEQKLAEILEDTPSVPTEEKSRTNDDILAELIENTRNMNRRLRDLDLNPPQEKRPIKSELMPKEQLQEIINTLLSEGHDLNTALELLEGRGIAPSPRVVRSLMDAISRKIVNENDKVKP